MITRHIYCGFILIVRFHFQSSSIDEFSATGSSRVPPFPATATQRLANHLPNSRKWLRCAPINTKLGRNYFHAAMYLNQIPMRCKACTGTLRLPGRATQNNHTHSTSLLSILGKSHTQKNVDPASGGVSLPKQNPKKCRVETLPTQQLETTGKIWS